MDELKSRYITLQKNLNTLRKREAKYAGNAPLDLLNQIADHQTALDLIKHAFAGELTIEAVEEALAPLNLALDRGPQISMGDVEGWPLPIWLKLKLVIPKNSQNAYNRRITLRDT